MMEKKEELAELMTKEQGKPLKASRNEVLQHHDFGCGPCFLRNCCILARSQCAGRLHPSYHFPQCRRYLERRLHADCHLVRCFINHDQRRTNSGTSSSITRNASSPPAELTNKIGQIMLVKGGISLPGESSRLFEYQLLTGAYFP